MQRLFCSKSGSPITLQQLLASHGEGEVWTTSHSGQLAKLYHNPTHARQEKLRAMVPFPPDLPPSITPMVAWPQSLIFNAGQEIVGFLMPHITNGRETIDLYNPSRRKRLGIKADWRFLTVTAHNIASVVATLHRQDIVLGDMKPQNILVTPQAVPAIIDTDSFQFKHPKKGIIYRCEVGSEGFTPPELMGEDFQRITQFLAHDHFRLGVMLYHLLLGSHPFQGQWMGAGEPPTLGQLIAGGHWVFGETGLLRPSPLTIPLTVLPPSLQDLFHQCFSGGHDHPPSRPTARQWQQTLAQVLPALTACETSPSHWYYDHRPRCDWCDRRQRLNTDIFDPTPQPPPQPVVPVPSRPRVPLPPLPLQGPPSLWVVPVCRGNSYRYQLRPWVQIGLWLGGGLTLWGLVQVWTQPPRPIQFHPEATAPAYRLSPTPIPTPPPLAPPSPQPMPTPLALLVHQGYGLYLQGELAQARFVLDRALSQDPQFAEAYYYRSLVRKTLGDDQGASVDWQVAQELAPYEMPFNPLFPSLDLALPAVEEEPASLYPLNPDPGQSSEESRPWDGP